MNEPTIPAAKANGTGHITYRCFECHELIVDDEPVLTHIDGRLVALHSRHKQEERTNGR